MNTSPDTFKHGTPFPEKTELERARLNALERTVTDIDVHLDNAPEPTTVSMFGGEMPIRPESTVDRIVAEAQAIYHASELAHQEAIQGGEHQREKAAAVLANLYKSNEVLVSNFAEIMEHFPEIAEKVARRSPGLLALLEANNKQHPQRIFDIGQKAANDDVFDTKGAA